MSPKRQAAPRERAGAGAGVDLWSLSRILHTPYAPCICGAGPPSVRPQGVCTARGIFRAMPRMAKGAARVPSSFLRVSDTCYGYLIKYNLPGSKGS